MMGSQFVKERGAMALLNCAFITTEDINTRGSFPFTWAMDALMLGVGVGFDTKGAGKIVIKNPKKLSEKELIQIDAGILDINKKFIIPDDREGWVQALKIVVEGFFEGKFIPDFDYDKIRPYGAPIKGFGGVASGPEPLKNLLEGIQNLLNKKIGEKISSTDIVDMMNMIGVCVVAGNVRRSAMIALGDWNDKDYVTMKDYNLHPEEVKTHRWASNNSVLAEIGKTKYSEFVDSIALNGEPGIIWLNNIRTHGRMVDPEDTRDKYVMGLNPCFSGETLIGVADGRGAVPISKLAEEGIDVPVYSVNKEGMVEIKMGRNPRITGYNMPMVKVILDDGSFIKTTLNHKFRLINGEEIEAKDLKKDMSLTRFTKLAQKMKNDGKDYIRILTNTNNSKKDVIFEHRLIAKFYNKEKWNSVYNENEKNGWINGGLVIHHKDYNGLNNSPENLEIMTFKEHAKFHGAIDNSGEKNGMFGKTQTEYTKKLIGEKAKERMLNEEYRNNLSNKIKDYYKKNSEAKKLLKEIRDKNYKEWCEKFIATTDLETLFIDNVLYVKKNCEYCGKEMILPARQREQVYCSISCANMKKESTEARKDGQNKFFVDKQRNTLHNQIMLFKDLFNKFRRNPLKKEWEVECKNKGIPFRTRTNGGNEFTLKSFNDLIKRAENYNHRVKEIEFLTERETVYNITVDDNHTVAIFTNYNNFIGNGIFTPQCGEIPLESGELCNLCETFPSRHESFEEFKTTLKYAYLYAKTVTLVPTHVPETNAVMMKNRRIGISQSGIIDAFARHGRRTMMQWNDIGYKYLRDLDELYSNWLCVPRSNRITTVKPSGTTALLPGVSAGIHYPEAEYYVRRIRIASNSPLVLPLIEAGFDWEYSAYGMDEDEKKKTLVFSFPIKEKYFIKSKRDVSVWEQVKNAVDYQRLWSDNSVSITVTFKPEEKKDIPLVLEAYEDSLKAISFLPLEENGYVQAPYEEISKEKYYELYGKINTSNFKNLSASIEAVGDKYCTTDKCQTV